MHLYPHRPVLIQEILEAFRTLSLQVVVDGTLGAGGHAEALLQQHPEISCYLGIDQDPVALKVATKRLEPWKEKLIIKQGNFAQLDQFLAQHALPQPNAILLDLGVSSMQIDEAERGFSFMRNGPLDMRMNPLQNLTAAFVVQTFSEAELGEIFREYGEEKQWKLAARTIVRARQTQAILTTEDLVKILYPSLQRHAKKGIHPLTLVFQALRICVNRELDVLSQLLEQSLFLLASKGRMAIISFHSLEDRLVKNHMRLEASDKWQTSGLAGLFQDRKPTGRLVNKKPIIATEEEVKINPRSRSAKLRVLEKL